MDKKHLVQTETKPLNEKETERLYIIGNNILNLNKQIIEMNKQIIELNTDIFYINLF